jgi:2-polyprenyl-6-methoxyphenol hydroxylase-like FAD-dependent oxidoreductase
MDPITGQGIGDALRDAELLAAALAGYERARGREALPMYELTGELASFAPPRSEQQALFAALARRQADVDRFLGVMTGAVPLAEFFSARNMLRLLGIRGLAAMALRGRRQAAAG